MKRPILLLTGLLVVVGAALLFYFTSSLSRTTATVTFSQDKKQKGLNELRVKAPHGYYVIYYNVVPRSLGNERQQKPFAVGGSSMGNRPMGLFGDDALSSNFFPDSGTIDEIPVETHVRIASNLNPAATMEMPEDERILSRCGIYLIVTKDQSTYQRLSSIVENWAIDAEQGGGGQPATRPESKPEDGQKPKIEPEGRPQ